MGQRLRSGATFANVVALLALTISLSGGVYAAAKIDGKDIKRGSVPGNRLADDGVTGKQVDESSLDEVPSARRVDGRKPSDFVAASDTRRIRLQTTTSSHQSQPVLALGTLRLSLVCHYSSLEGYASVGLEASSTTTSTAGYDVNGVRFDAGSNQPKVDGGLLDVTHVVASAAAYNDADKYGRNVGTLVYNSDGGAETITVTFALFSRFDPSGAFCNLAGSAVRVHS